LPGYAPLAGIITGILVPCTMSLILQLCSGLDWSISLLVGQGSHKLLRSCCSQCLQCHWMSSAWASVYRLLT